MCDILSHSPSLTLFVEYITLLFCTALTQSPQQIPPFPTPTPSPRVTKTPLKPQIMELLLLNAYISGSTLLIASYFSSSLIYQCCLLPAIVESLIFSFIPKECIRPFHLLVEVMFNTIEFTRSNSKSEVKSVIKFEMTAKLKNYYLRK